jgi:protein O-GlcNAc transferase
MKLDTDQILEQAITAHKEGRFEDAEHFYNTILRAEPKNADANHNLGVLATSLKATHRALILFETALEVKPNVETFWISYIDALIKNNRLEDAEIASRKALDLKQDFIEVNFILSAILIKRGELVEAEAILKKIIEFKPDYAEAYYSLGVIQYKAARFIEAEASYKSATKFKRDYIQAYNNLGVIQYKAGRFIEAEASVKKALDLKPDYAEGHYTLGNIFKISKRIDEASESYERAIALKPNMNYLLGASLHAKMHQCRWGDLSQDLTKITKKINNGEKILTPFILNSLIDDPSLQRKSAEIYSKDKYPKSDILPKLTNYQGHKKIRIGYFSANFNNHPVSYLTVELYESHDRNIFEIHGFSLGPNIKDEFNTRIKAGVDHFHDVSRMSDRDIVMFARSLEIDIAVDLSGFTEGCRPGIFAMSAASTQVSYIGYPGTMGANYYDYLISDKTIIPERNKKYYLENIVYLPSYQVNESINYSQNISLNKKDLNIPEEAFVFCCFNDTYKITPDIFNCWIQILKQVDNSVLMLFAENDTAIKNLKTQISNNGISLNRLIFTKRLARQEYLLRYQVVDLFLDTFPCNAGAIASDSLRMGLPLLTCLGESFSSRMAASLLNSLDLPELVTITLKQYKLFAIELATNPEKFNALKKKLVSSLPTAQLYDTSLFTKKLEAAYLIIQERHQEGLNSIDIEIE